MDAWSVFLAVANEQNTGKPMADARVVLLETDDDIIMDECFGDIVLMLGEFTEEEVGIWLVGFDLEDSAKLLAGFGVAVHAHEQLADIEECVDVARVNAEFS